MIAQATRTRPGLRYKHAPFPSAPPPGRLAKPMRTHRLTGRMPGGKQASGGELYDERQARVRRGQAVPKAEQADLDAEQQPHRGAGHQRRCRRQEPQPAEHAEDHRVQWPVVRFACYE
jgi:hypothetical protein